MKIRDLIRRFKYDDRGIGMLELIVATTVLSAAGTLFMSSVFQAINSNEKISNELLATRELRRAGSTFATDAVNASSVDVIDGAPATSTVTMTWTDSEGTSHTAYYWQNGTDLIRDLDGATRVIARRVSSTGFSLASKLLTFDLIVLGTEGATVNKSTSVYLRMMP